MRFLLVVIIAIPLFLYWNEGQNKREQECKIRLEYITESRQKVDYYLTDTLYSAADLYRIWSDKLDSQLGAYAERC